MLIPPTIPGLIYALVAEVSVNESISLRGDARNHYYVFLLRAIYFLKERNYFRTRNFKAPIL